MLPCLVDGRREEGKSEGSREPPIWSPVTCDAGILDALFSVTGIHDSGTNLSMENTISNVNNKKKGETRRGEERRRDDDALYLTMIVHQLYNCFT